MNDELTLVKFVNDEVRYFPTGIYNVMVSDGKLTIVHNATKSITMEADMSSVLYIRYHMPKKAKEGENDD